MKWKVEIIKASTGEVVTTMDARSERQAEQIERGANINLNHSEYFTKVGEAE